MKYLNRNTIVLLVFSLSIMLSSQLFSQNDKALQQEKEKEEMLKAKEQDIQKKQDLLKDEKKELKKEKKFLKDEAREVKQELKENKRGIAKKPSDAHQSGKVVPRGSDQDSKLQTTKPKEGMDEKEKPTISAGKDEKGKPTLSSDKDEKGKPTLSSDKDEKGKPTLSSDRDKRGREYGLQRAEEARSKQAIMRKDHLHSVGLAEKKAKLGREKIKIANKDLEEAKRLKKIKEEDYQLKKERINRAEEAIKRLEGKLKIAKELEK